MAKQGRLKQPKQSFAVKGCFIEPRQNKFPSQSKNVKPSLAYVDVKKRPKSQEKGSIYDFQMRWRCEKANRDGIWSWGDPRNWSQDEWDTKILPSFKEWGMLRWREICSQPTGNRGKMHHEHEFHSIAKEAQERWFERDLDEFADQIFRFRLSGKWRVWGFTLQHIFFIVWLDRMHKIYPVEK